MDIDYARRTDKEVFDPHLLSDNRTCPAGNPGNQRLFQGEVLEICETGCKDYNDSRYCSGRSANFFPSRRHSTILHSGKKKTDKNITECAAKAARYISPKFSLYLLRKSS